VTTVLALLGIAVLFAPIPAAFIGHRLDWRRQHEDDDIERIEAGFHTWYHPTPPTPLRAVAWPERQAPTDLAPAYAPIDAPTAHWPWHTGYIDTPPPDWDAIVREARAWNWAVAELARIREVCRQYDELALSVHIGRPPAEVLAQIRSAVAA